MAKAKAKKAPIEMEINGKKLAVSALEVDDIIKYCKDNGAVDWLKETANKKYQKKDGTERAITFVELKAEFMKKFYADKVVGSKKEPTFLDKINQL